MEKFELLYKVLLSLHHASVLNDCVLIGSWCQDFYRHMYGNPFQIPAATTTDADLLLPKKLKFKPPVDIAGIMEETGFTIEHERTDGLMRFIHEDFKVEFITEAGAKGDEAVHRFKNLSITAQELHFMTIPIDYNIQVPFRDIVVRIPEPQAFALHKLIVSQRRTNPDKKLKDIAAARGLLEFFEDDESHLRRLHEIFSEFPKGWKSKVNEALKAAGMELPPAKSA